MAPQTVSPLPRLVAAALLILTLIPAFIHAGEPEDLKAIKELLDLGVNRSALNRCKLYMERNPDGAHRAQVAAWGGSLLLQAGRPGEALPMLEAAAGGEGV